MIKYDRHGRYKWAVGIDGLYEDRCNGVAVDTSDNVFMMGQTISCPIPITSAQNFAIQSMDCQGIATYIAMFDPDGNMLWAAEVDGLTDETPTGIAIDKFDSLYLVGLSNSPTVSITDGQLRQLVNIDLATANDAWFFKLNKNETVFSSETRGVNTAENRITLPKNEKVGTASTETATVSNVISTMERVSASDSNVTLTYIVVGASASFFMLVGIIGVYVWAKQCSKRHRGSGRAETTMQGTKTDVFNVTTGQTVTAMTALMSNHELSIPAFLQMNYGTDFRQEKFIAEGGGGSCIRVLG